MPPAASENMSARGSCSHSLRRNESSAPSMKVETLQTYCVAILILGLFLAAVGGFGAYFYGSKSDRLQRQQTASVVQTVDSRVMRLLARQQALEMRLDSIERRAVAQAPPPPPPPVAVAVAEPVPTPIPGLVGRPVASVPPPSVPVAEVSPEIPRQLRAKPITDLRTSLTVLGLSSQQGAAFVRRLRTQRGRTVVIHVPEGKFDALDRAQAFKNVFLAADWRVTGVQEVRSRRSGRGMSLSSGTFPPPMEVATILSGLLSAGFQVETDLDPNQRQHRAVLFVGSK